ncbi:host cell division inhibitor Icd-like protein [Brenneria goodwinii]|uniref:host cell division inhibitor Icd-like protein n=1 Tax=Brenneria goodwinii TaxID=1109412 RepID=UPI0036E19423
MADVQFTQTRPEFQYRFLAQGILSQSIVQITAATECKAREQSPNGHVMVFAGRLPIQETRHV